MLAEWRPTPPARSQPTISQASAESVPGRPTPAQMLTTKETAILMLIDKGMPNKLIARSLDVSGETIKWHLRNVYMKLSVGSRRHAVERARLLGLLQ
jgi:LuxR family maltose regulon positive regulatory protein